MPKIDISKAVFKRLEKLAEPEPFLDNPNKVIKKLLDFYERSKLPAPTLIDNNESPIIKFDPDNPPDLKNSSLLNATVEEQPVSSWNKLMRQVLKEIYDRSQKAHEENPSDSDGLQVILNDLEHEIRQGRYEEKGFRYDQEMDVSIRGLDANSAWRHARRLAKKRHIQIEVNFQLLDGRCGTFEELEPTPPPPDLFN